MKKLVLLLFLIPLVSFGQQPTYANPNPQPIKVQVQNKTNPYAVPANNNTTVINRGPKRALVTTEPKTNIRVPLEVDMYNYTHLLLVGINLIRYGNGIRWIEADDRNYYNQYEKSLISSPLKIMNPVKVDKRKFKKNPLFLREMKNPKYLYLYLTKKKGSGNDDVNTSLIIRDHKNKILYSASHVNVGDPDILYPLIGF